MKSILSSLITSGTSPTNTIHEVTSPILPSPGEEIPRLERGLSRRRTFRNSVEPKQDPLAEAKLGRVTVDEEMPTEIELDTRFEKAMVILFWVISVQFNFYNAFDLRMSSGY